MVRHRHIRKDDLINTLVIGCVVQRSIGVGSEIVALLNVGWIAETFPPSEVLVISRQRRVVVVEGCCNSSLEDVCLDRDHRLPDGIFLWQDRSICLTLDIRRFGNSNPAATVWFNVWEQALELHHR